MKKIILSVILIVTLLLFAGCSAKKQVSTTTEIDTPSAPVEPAIPTEPETPDEPKDEFEARTFPMDESGSVKIRYAQELLVRKSVGEVLEGADAELIDYFFLENGKGLAWVDLHFIGMQQAVSRVFMTHNNGETWALLDDHMSFLVGPYDCTHIDGTMIISSFATVVETNSFTIVDVDGNIRSIKCEEVSDVVDLEGLYAEFQPSENKNEIVCHWKKFDYDDPRVVYVSVHDKDMKTIDISKYKKDTVE